MAQTTAFKVPFEELRGKLATKQKDIAYSGQEGDSPASVRTGTHASTNFNKYIVAYKRNDKNRFYVKSRATIHQTAAARRSKANLAFAVVLADYLQWAISTGGAAGRLVANELTTLWEAYSRNGGKTYSSVREFVIASITPQMGNVSLLGITVPDYRIAGVYASALVFDKGINDTSLVIVNSDGSSSGLQDFANYLTTLNLYEKNALSVFRNFADQIPNTTLYSVNISIEGVTEKFLLPIKANNTIDNNNPLMKAVGCVASTTAVQLALFRENTNPKSKGATYTLYTDSTETTLATTTTTINADTILYGKEGLA